MMYSLAASSTLTTALPRLPPLASASNKRPLARGEGCEVGGHAAGGGVVAVAKRRRRAARQRRRDEVVAVGARLAPFGAVTGQADEQIAAVDRARVGRDAGDLDVERPLRAHHLERV